MLINAAPVADGFGKRLLKKMGWQEGEGLGKHREGTIEPIRVDIKVDRRGLVSKFENAKTKNQKMVETCGKFRFKY